MKERPIIIRMTMVMTPMNGKILNLVLLENMVSLTTSILSLKAVISTHLSNSIAFVSESNDHYRRDQSDIHTPTHEYSEIHDGRQHQQFHYHNDAHSDGDQQQFHYHNDAHSGGDQQQQFHYHNDAHSGGDQQQQFHYHNDSHNHHYNHELPSQYPTPRFSYPRPNDDGH